MTTQTSVIEILRTVEYSVDFGSVHNYPGETEDDQRTNFWIDVITKKASDTGFGHLVESILEEGFHGSAIGWHPENCDITEGHHRLVAAILLGMDYVDTSTYGIDGDHLSRDDACDYRFSAHDNRTDPYPIDIEMS